MEDLTKGRDASDNLVGVRSVEQGCPVSNLRTTSKALIPVDTFKRQSYYATHATYRLNKATNQNK